MKQKHPDIVLSQGVSNFATERLGGGPGLQSVRGRERRSRGCVGSSKFMRHLCQDLAVTYGVRLSFFL